MPKASTKPARSRPGVNGYTHNSALVAAFKNVIETKTDEMVEDMLVVEYLWFSRTRAIILQSLYESATNGSDYAIKIYYEWMRDNEVAHEKLLSQARPVTPNAASWVQKSLKSGAKAQVEASSEQTVTVPVVEAISDSDIAEAPANTGQE